MSLRRSSNTALNSNSGTNTNNNAGAATSSNLRPAGGIVNAACNTKPNEKCRFRPIAEPATGQQVVLMIVMYVCRKILFYNTAYKIAVYLLLLFVGSLMCDFFPLPRNYFSQKTNVFNVYFVKLGWGWTLVLVGTFVLLSSYVYCCGDRALVRRHLSRLAVGTVLWFATTTVFGFVEAATGMCTVNPARNVDKLSCIRAGHRWYGFDISGHAFLLIFCSLIIMEESRSMRGWERIGEMIRQDEFDDESPLKNLSEEQFRELRVSYGCLGLYVKFAFIAMTLLGLLWDFMLVCTTLYFHSMVQKVVGALVAVALWFVMYRLWYPTMGPGMPGEGPFRYATVRVKKLTRLPQRVPRI